MGVHEYFQIGRPPVKRDLSNTDDISKPPLPRTNNCFSFMFHLSATD